KLTLMQMPILLAPIPSWFFHPLQWPSSCRVRTLRAPEALYCAFRAVENHAIGIGIELSRNRWQRAEKWPTSVRAQIDMRTYYRYAPHYLQIAGDSRRVMRC